jgi:hypothetical protein
MGVRTWKGRMVTAALGIRNGCSQPRPATCLSTWLSCTQAMGFFPGLLASSAEKDPRRVMREGDSRTASEAGASTLALDAAAASATGSSEQKEPWRPSWAVVTTPPRISRSSSYSARKTAFGKLGRGCCHSRARQGEDDGSQLGGQRGLTHGSVAFA